MKLALHLLAPILPLLLSAALPENPGLTSLPARPVEVEGGRWAAHATERVFKSREEFETYFGQRALGVDFGHEWVVLYSAGPKPTTGYVASIDAIEHTENSQSLKITSSLVRPGRSCEVEARRTLPYALAAFPAMRVKRDGPGVVRFAHDESIAICN
jgi:hypothetical protein